MDCQAYTQTPSDSYYGKKFQLARTLDNAQLFLLIHDSLSDYLYLLFREDDKTWRTFMLNLHTK
jgi:hypothetical protein